MITPILSISQYRDMTPFVLATIALLWVSRKDIRVTGLRSAVLDRAARVQAGVILALLAFVLLVLPSMLSSYWVDVMTSVVIYSVVALGLGLLMAASALCRSGRSRSSRSAPGSRRA